MLIRKAELWDVPALFDLAEMFHEEAGIGYPIPEPLAIHQTIIESKQFDAIFCFVAEDNKTIVGFIVGGMSRMAHSFSYLASTSFFYVNPKKRGSKAAKLLFDKYFQWCKEHSVSVKTAAPISGIRTKQMCRMLGKYGFKKSGFSYVC